MVLITSLILHCCSKNVIPSNIIIRNGNLCNAGIRVEGKQVLPRNTCGIDALATCFYNGIMESDNFRQEAMTSTDPVVKIAEFLAKEGATTATYAARGRAALMWDDSGSREINMFTSITNIIERWVNR